MRRQRFRWLAVFAASGLLLTACGGDDDDDSGGGGTAESDFETVAIDESDQCDTDGYAGNLAGIEAVDELTVRFPNPEGSDSFESPDEV